jgi:ubiquinone/menaquinone biosynthesis C-methylase UbiE
VKTLLAEKFAAPDEAKLWAQFVAFAPFVFQVAQCLRNFGILKTLTETETGKTIEEISHVVDLSEYSLSVLLDGGESSGLLVKEDSRYTLTLAGRHIQEDNLTQMNLNFTNDVCYQGLFHLEESLRHQVPAGLKVFGEWPTIYAGLTQLPKQTLKSWLAFDHFFSDDAFPRALPILFKDSPQRILDVGGNTGKFAMACARFNSSVKVTLLDHPEQLALARKNFAAQNLGDRVQGVAIDLLDHSIPFPKDHDLIWMSQFLDCFDKSDILQLFKRAHAALPVGGFFYIMEPFTDRQRHQAAKFCLDMTSLYFTCMANGKSRMYPAADFYELLKQADLEVVEEFTPIRLSHTILKCRARPS